jgi:palmitoyltransferase
MASTARPSLEKLAIPAVSFLIIFLAYSSQYLFHHIDPGPLSIKEATWFNALVGAIWWTYYRACTVDPGRKGWVEKASIPKDKEDEPSTQIASNKRWCKKCNAVKPPRAHHCKQCKR